MRAWLDTLRVRLAQWMYGRYGTDALSVFLHTAVFVCVVVSFVPAFSFLAVAGLCLLTWDIFRTLSRNCAARKKELNIYLREKKKLTDQWKLAKQIFRERKTHCYFRCPACRAMLRVPKHRGEIVVTCPKCKTKTDKKT